jgi:uncharacterized repeat protein (TIGR01451 family)
MTRFISLLRARAATAGAALCAVFVTASAWSVGARPASADPSPVALGARVVVHAVGDRSGDDATALADVTFQAYRDAGFAVAIAGASCTTGTDGACELTGLPPATRVYVRAVTVPAPFHRIDTLTTTDDGSTGYGASATTGSPGSVTVTRPMVAPRVDPPFPGECGLDIALVMDLSNSIDPDELLQMKTAARAFVTALQGTPSSVAGFTFATEAPAGGNADLPLTDVSGAAGADRAREWIDARTEPSEGAGGTNWDAALRQLVPKAAEPDVVVLLTDGNPTYSGDPRDGGNGADTTFAEVEAGVLSANAVKAANPALKLVGIAIGERASVDNLGAVTGPVLGDDLFLAASFGDLQAKLQELATRLCGGTLTVKKLVAGPDGFRPAGGWAFTVAGASPASAVTDEQTGVTPAFAVASGTATVTETRRAGYDLVAQQGRHASCTRNGSPIAPTDLTDVADGVALHVGALDIVACEFRNRPAPATLQIEKVWQGAAPDESPRTVVDVTGPSSSSTPVAGPARGTIGPLDVVAGRYHVAESSLDPEWVQQSMTCARGGRPSFTPDPDGIEIGAGDHVVCTIVNAKRSPEVPAVDLSITKSDGGAAPVAGNDAFTYTLTVDNRGPADAVTAATVVDVLPEGVEFARFGALPDGVTCTPPTGRTLECSIAAVLLTAVAPAVVVPVEVTVPATTTGGSVTNRAIVGNVEDPAPCTATDVTITCEPAGTDNYAEVTTPVIQVEAEVVPPPAAPPPPAPRAPRLAFTGAGTVRLAAVGVTLVALGTALVVVVQRRRRPRRV